MGLWDVDTWAEVCCLQHTSAQVKQPSMRTNKKSLSVLVVKLIHEVLYCTPVDLCGLQATPASIWSVLFCSVALHLLSATHCG